MSASSVHLSPEILDRANSWNAVDESWRGAQREEEKRRNSSATPTASTGFDWHDLGLDLPEKVDLEVVAQHNGYLTLREYYWGILVYKGTLKVPWQKGSEEEAIKAIRRKSSLLKYREHLLSIKEADIMHMKKCVKQLHERDVPENSALKRHLKNLDEDCFIDAKLVLYFAGCGDKREPVLAILVRSKKNPLSHILVDLNGEVVHSESVRFTSM